MTTFAKPQPLTAQITYALMQLRQARFDGDATCITIAQRRLDRLIDRLPRSTAQE
ncbi:hypothetical protein [Mycobacterium dioxanotrophicus]|uniref:hypothetical protein n=1 Tax=Mycobacterium dioxanotrophicus TaxID=482462 RepID=UPI0018DF20A7|nr:hypothetical protein [Mycobacterium dioxanotrophicus]